MKTQSALCAKDVKQLLKKEYPTIDFSVRSDNFANGNSVHVSWNLGPTSDEVDKLLRKYQYGYFDGMTDMYEYSNSRDDIPQAKYVSCSREYKTNEEIENDKLSWEDPKRRNLYKEEKTLYHMIGRDLCKVMNIEYIGLNETMPPKDFQHMIRGYAYGGNLQALVYQLLNPIRFMDGYHGVRNEKTEKGEVITNSFELY